MKLGTNMDHKHTKREIERLAPVHPVFMKTSKTEYGRYKQVIARHGVHSCVGCGAATASKVTMDNLLHPDNNPNLKYCKSILVNNAEMRCRYDSQEAKDCRPPFSNVYHSRNIEMPHFQRFRV